MVTEKILVSLIFFPGRISENKEFRELFWLEFGKKIFEKNRKACQTELKGGEEVWMLLFEVKKFIGVEKKRKWYVRNSKVSLPFKIFFIKVSKWKNSKFKEGGYEKKIQ